MKNSFLLFLGLLGLTLIFSAGCVSSIHSGTPQTSDTPVTISFSQTPQSQPSDVTTTPPPTPRNPPVTQMVYSIGPASSTFEPEFGYGDVIEDQSGHRYAIYNENMKDSGNYLVYDISSCPTEKKIILRIQDVDGIFKEVDHINPSLACTVLAKPSISCSITGRWEPETSDGLLVYVQFYPDNRVEVYRGFPDQSYLLNTFGTYEISGPNKIIVEWDGGYSETIQITSDCKMSSKAFRSNSNFVRVDKISNK
jgi:hypothetical protein